MLQMLRLSALVFVQFILGHHVLALLDVFLKDGDLRWTVTSLPVGMLWELSLLSQINVSLTDSLLLNLPQLRILLSLSFLAKYSLPSYGNCATVVEFTDLNTSHALRGELLALQSGIVYAPHTHMERIPLSR